MQPSSQIFLYKDEPGGGSGRVVKVLCAPGTIVDIDQHLFDVETAKACQEIRAPQKGRLAHALREGQDVDFGALLAEILPDNVDAAPFAGKVRTETAAPLGAQTGRPAVSYAAARLLDDLGIDAASLGSALVTTGVVRRKLADKATTAEKPTQSQDWTALPWHKLREAEALAGCAGGSYLSMVGLEIPGLAHKRPGAGFFDNKILDLVVLESARLMPSFPNLNAAWRAAGRVEFHKDVVPGIAFHGGSHLVTYAVKPAELVDLESTQAAILSGLKKYARNDLTREDTGGATYTISDLSTTGADFVLPLVPVGQSCIIGITRDREGFRLNIAFDHRLSDGFEATRFLKGVASRIQKSVGKTSDACHYCGTTPVSADRTTFLLPLQDSAGNRRLCCRTCWSDLPA